MYVGDDKMRGDGMRENWRVSGDKVIHEGC